MERGGGGVHKDLDMKSGAVLAVKDIGARRGLLLETWLALISANFHGDLGWLYLRYLLRASQAIDGGSNGQSFLLPRRLTRPLWLAIWVGDGKGCCREKSAPNCPPPPNLAHFPIWRT